MLLKSNEAAFSPLTQSLPLVARKEDSGSAQPSEFFLEIRVLDAGWLTDLSSGMLDNYLLSLRRGCYEIEFCSSSLVPR